jgi:hypothetical protein
MTRICGPSDALTVVGTFTPLKTPDACLTCGEPIKGLRSVSWAANGLDFTGRPPCGHEVPLVEPDRTGG